MKHLGSQEGGRVGEGRVQGTQLCDPPSLAPRRASLLNTEDCSSVSFLSIPLALEGSLLTTARSAEDPKATPEGNLH